jgi:transforming growth factor-beta-induced protein
LSTSPSNGVTTLTSAASASSDAGSPTGSTDLSGSGTSTSSSRFDRAKDALAAGDFSTFLNLLQLSGLAHDIEERQVTILAPTEDAFKKLTKDQLADLATNPTKIDDILKRHIVDEVLSFDELAAKSSVTTLSGDTLTVSKDGGTVTVNGAVVSEPKSDSVSGEEGQEISVLGIDTVLLDGK